MNVIKLSNDIFEMARTYFDDQQIFNFISLWIYQGKTYELIKVVNKKNSDVRDISKALSHYIEAISANKVKSKITERWLLVELTRRFLTENPKLIDNVTTYISVEDFYQLLDSFVCSPNSTG